MITQKIILILFFLTTLTSCGTNIFQGLAGEPEKSLLESIEDASTTEDYNLLIEEADSIINSNSATNEEKAEAHLIKAEAILGKSGITAIDIMGDLASGITNGNNPINTLATTTDINDLITASESITAASTLGSPGDENQNLMKGIVNTMIVMNTITEEFSIDENGNIENNVSSYSTSLDNIMYPGDQTDNDILHYSEEAIGGFTNSNALTNEQNQQIQTISDQIELLKNLNESGDSESEKENQITSIFQGF